MTRIVLRPPAKLNLGLEVVRRRADGFHDIDTIMAMIDLCDEIDIRLTGGTDVRIVGMDDVPAVSNLIHRAASLFATTTGLDVGGDYIVTKRIPSPGGLGGGSSDAASVLEGLNLAHSQPLSRKALAMIATRLGADCAFFLGSPTAQATGLGDQLDAMDPPDFWATVVTTPIDLGQKTRLLYQSLGMDDFSNGTKIAAVRGEIARAHIPSQPVHNAFVRPLARISPRWAMVRQEIERATDLAFSLTGAGPSVYRLCDSESGARVIAEKVRTSMSGDVQIGVHGSLRRRPQPLMTLSE